MKLNTQYLGLQLDSPLMAGASPMGNDLDLVRRRPTAGRAHRGAPIIRRAAPGGWRRMGLRPDVDDQPIVVELDPGGPPDGGPGAGPRPGGQCRELVGARQRVGLTLSRPWQRPQRAPGWPDRGGR